MSTPQHSEKVLPALWVFHDVLDKPFSSGRPPKLDFFWGESGPVFTTTAIDDSFEHGAFLLNLGLQKVNGARKRKISGGA